MRPLEGITVVELSTFVAGPTAARLLAEWGAEVIKVEGLNGDPIRSVGGPSLNVPPELFQPGQDYVFDLTSANKKYVALNVKTDEGRKLLLTLLEHADVFITNYRNAALKALGLTYEEIHEKLPRLIYGHIVGYGEKGPDKDRPGFDFTAFGARGGLVGSLHQKDGEPINNLNSFGDLQAGMCMAAGICAAITGRCLHGNGERVVVGLYNAAIYAASWALASAQFGEQYPRSRKGDNLPFINTYRGSDGVWMQMCVSEHDRYYQKVIALLGRPDLADDARYNTLSHVNECHTKAELSEIMEAQFLTKPSQEWLALFTANDLTLEKAYTMNEILEDEQAWANDYLVRVQYHDGTEATYIPAPVQFADAGGLEFHPSRPLAADNEVVFQRLGLDPNDLAELRETGILPK